jgi:regulator of replication initiation timing
MPFTENIFMNKPSSVQRGGVTLWATIGVVVIIAAILAFHFLSRMQPAEVRSFQELVNRVEKINTQISEREQQISSLVGKYNQSHPGNEIDTTGMSAMGLTEDQAQLLANRVAQEKDLSYRGMLQEVIDVSSEMAKLQQELGEVKARLRPPVTAQKGDTHLAISLKFLTEEIGMNEEDALKMIEKEALVPELLPGFEVWNYYGEGIFGTFVTQGQAKITPNELTRATKRKIDAERNTLIQERNQKQTEVDDLEARKNELQQQIRSLEEERTSMMQQVTLMAQSNDSLAQELNSLKYHIGTFRDLERSGAIRKPALGKWNTGDIDAVQHTGSLDLRKDARIVINASSLGLEKVEKILVFPRYFREDGDYRIELSEDRKSATVVFEKPAKFNLSRLVIAVG